MNSERQNNRLGLSIHNSMKAFGASTPSHSS